MNRPRAILYDFDGTIVDSRRDIADACNAMLVAHGREGMPLERVLPMIGDGARTLVARALGLDPGDPGVDLPLATFMQRYAEHPCVHTALLPGAREALAMPIPAALVTNKPRGITMLVLEGLGLTQAFAAVRGGGDGPLKPDPAMIVSVLEEMGVAPGDAWVVGDGPQDVLAGKAAGCFTLFVPGIADRAQVTATNPDRVLRSLADLVPMITALRA